MILGGSRWSEKAAQQFAGLRRAAFSLPVYCSFRRQMLMSAGTPAMRATWAWARIRSCCRRIRNADLVLLVGGRLSEVPSQGYELLGIPTPQQALVHVNADADELGKLYRPAQAIHATPQAFAEAVSTLRPSRNAGMGRPPPHQPRQDFLALERPGADPHSRPAADGRGHARTCARCCRPTPSSATARATSPPGCTASGRSPPSPASWRPPAARWATACRRAWARKRLWPQREVVVFAGDGDFLMHGQEFATAVQYGLPIIVVLLDNAMYGTIRMHQEKHYPGRISATQLKNPDFRGYAEVFGGHGERVTSDRRIRPRRWRARGPAASRPSCIACSTRKRSRPGSTLQCDPQGSAGCKLEHLVSFARTPKRLSATHPHSEAAA